MYLCNRATCLLPSSQYFAIITAPTDWISFKLSLTWGLIQTFNSMNTASGLVAVFGLAFAVSLFLTRQICTISHHLSLFDLPSDRKLHSHPTPRLGGLAIAITFALGLTAAAMLFSDFYTFARERFWAVLLGGVLIFTTGLIDDVHGLHFGYKFALQFLSAAVVIWGGEYQIRSLAMPFLEQPILLNDWQSLCLTFLWIVGICNAVNLIDGLDGLAGGVSSIGLLFMMTTAFLHSDTTILPIYTALLGAILGFLRYNFFPARIFMGDSGALFIGFIFACSALIPHVADRTPFALSTPVLAFAFPILDTTLAPVRRLLAGRHPFKPDMLHLHHRLVQQCALSQPQAVIWIYLFSLLTGALAFVQSGLLFFAMLLLYGLLGIGLWIMSYRNAMQKKFRPFLYGHAALHRSRLRRKEKLLS